jgi:DNA-nicking Smr family endonuclease
MKKAGHKPGVGRAIEEDEARLWEHATRTLDPLKAKPRIAPGSSPPAAPRVLAQPRAEREAVPPSARARKPEPRPSPKAKSQPLVPLAEFDRRKVRRIASGKVEVDARIDLHGLRQRDAHGQLRAFLLGAYAKGHRMVLVITGKGGEASAADALGPMLGEGRRGILRQSVPGWLEEPDLRAVVSSYTQAGPRHGGAGALYVQLRKGGTRTSE